MLAQDSYDDINCSRNILLQALSNGTRHSTIDKVQHTPTLCSGLSHFQAPRQRIELKSLLLLAEYSYVDRNCGRNVHLRDLSNGTRHSTIDEA